MLFQGTQASVRVRSAQESDRLPLSSLFHFEPYIYRHLDWKRPLDWLGEKPFLVAERKERLVAALACPPDPPGVAWVRAFATSNQLRPEKAWNLLWEEAHRELSNLGEIQIAALCAEAWMQKLLKTSGFHQTHFVVLLAWKGESPLIPPHFQTPPRLMVSNDLEQVFALDWASFVPLWRNSQTTLQLAFNQAIFATVIQEGNEIIGYQMSTPSPSGGHLARLAVHPKAQGKGIGYALVYDLLVRFSKQGAWQVTVNTQAENTASLALYQKANFTLTGHDYPVYEYF